MRILLINQFYRPDVAATGQLLSDLAQGLAADGHEVHVLCSQRGYGGGQIKEEQIRDKPQVTSPERSSVHVHRVRALGFGRQHVLGRLADYLSFFVLAVWKAVFLPGMDVCVGLTTPPFVGLVGLFLKVLKGTRLVLWTMDLYPEVAVAYGAIKKNGLACRSLSCISRTLYRNASAIISLGEVMTQRLIEAGANPDKITTVHNWVPGESVRPIAADGDSRLQEEWDIDGRIVLMYSGNLGLGHDLDTIVKAVHLLGNTVNLRVLFIGDGKGKERLLQMAKELRLGCVDFYLPVPLERLSDSLAVGDIHIVSQKPGTQGLIVPSKLYGIMAAARPAIFIGPEDCEVAQVINDSGAGIVVPPGDQTALAKAIGDLANSPEKRLEMGQRGRNYYEQHFGQDKSVSRIIAAIKRIQR